DVEWAVQLLQLQHAHEHESLQTPMTLDALDAARQANLLTADQAQVLSDAWRLATSLRGAIALRGKDRNSDVMPSDTRELRVLAEIMNREVTGAELNDVYARLARRARTVTEGVFFGWKDGE